MKVFLILHNIRSVFNVGSIFRTADTFGVKKIYLAGYTPDPAPKTALGAEKYVEWERIKNTQKLIRDLKEKDVFIISLENHTSSSIKINRFLKIFQKASKKKLNKFNLSQKSNGSKFISSNKVKNIAIILGNEVRGISKSVLENSDAVVEIPMHGKKESLNVSVAAGITLYAIMER